MGESGWREPSSLLPLRWGSYRLRYLAGMCLAIAGGLLVQVTSAYSLLVLPLGLFLHILGWCILPGTGWRRVAGAAFSALSTILLLNGGTSAVFLVLPLTAWLFVRQRPLRSYVVLLLPVAAAGLLSQVFPEYGWGAVVLVLAGSVLAGASWLGRWLAATSRQNTATSR